MKKFVKWLLIFGAVLVVLVVVALAVALNSGVQTKIVLGVLQKTDPQAKLDSVAFGFSNGEVHGLELTAGGAHLKLGTAKLEYSLANLAFGSVKTIDSIEVSDLVVDLSSPAPTTPTSAAPATKPAGGQSKPLPAVLVKKAGIAGVVRLPASRSIDLSLNAQNVGAGADGQAGGTIIYHDQTAGASVSEMHTEAQIKISLDNAMFPKNVEATATLSATLPGQAQPPQISAHVVAKPVNAQTGELTLTLVPAGGVPLVSFNGTYTTAGVINGDFIADLTRDQVAPFAFGAKLPDFSFKAQGHVATDAAQHSGSVTTSLSGTVGHLDELRPELAGMGTLQLDTALDISVTQAAAADKPLSIAAKTLSVKLAPQGGKTAVAVDLLKPITLELGAQGLKLPAGAGADILKITLSQTPTAWLSAALPKDFSATGQGLNGQITVSARDDGGLVANTTQPITFAGLDVKQGAQTMLAGGVVDVDASAVYLNQALQAQVRRFSLQAHTVAANGVTLTDTLPNAAIISAGFAGNVSVVPGKSTPQVLATGQSAVTVDFDHLDQKALGTPLPPLNPAGMLTANATFDVATAAAANDPQDLSLNVNTLQVILSKGAGGTAATFATLAALQKFSVPMGKDAKLQPVAGDLATFEVNGFPLTVAQAFLPPRFKFSGQPLKGKVTLAGDTSADPAITLRTTEPFTISSAEFAQDGLDKLSGVTITLTPAGSLKANGLQASVHLLATSSAGSLLDVTTNVAKDKDTLTANVTASGQLAAIAAQPLGADWRNYLPATQPQFNVAASIAQNKDSLTIQSAEAMVAPAGGAALADIKLGQPITLQTDPADAKKFLWPKAKGAIVSIKLGNLPAGVLSLAVPGYRLQGQNISCDMAVTGAGDGNYTLAANAPITASGLSVTKLGDAKTPPMDWVRNLTFACQPTATFNDKGVSAGNVQNLSLSSGDTPLVAGNVDFAFDPGQSLPKQAKITARADLAELLRQPVLAKFDNLATGLLEVDGSLEPDGTARLNASVTDWAVKDGSVKLPQMTFQNATGKINRATGEVQVTVPIKGQGSEGPTDCVLAATYGPSGNSHKFSLNLTGNNLVIDDLMAVKAGLFPAPPAPAAGATPVAPVKPTATKPVVPDTVPIWGDLQGTAQIKLAALRFHSFTIDNFAASAQVSPTEASLPSVTGTFAGAPLSVSASLGFDKSQADQPYAVKSSLSFKNFDVGAYFKSRVAAGTTPPVEGAFSISGNTAGRGANIDDVIDKVQFDFKLESSSGTFHLLDMIPNKTLAGALKTVSSVAGMAGSVLSILGGGNKNVVSNKAAEASAILDLLSNLDQIQYSKLVLEAQRGADLTINLKQFDVLSTYIELTGSGQVTHQPGISIPDQPLSAALSLNAKGGVAQGLADLHLLGSALPNGYSQGPKFQVSGTLQHPDYGFLYNLLTSGVSALGLK